ncbi:MAG: type II toxin-antitoxin system PemK/MazF family toxin [Cyanobacteria bacterium P01_E01_bin.35]
MPIYKLHDVVVVPFPFTDRDATKRRPTLVVSDPKSLNIDKSILAMITSSSHQPWPLDVTIQNLAEAGLKSPSIIRMKLFTLDNSLILKKIGKLSQQDIEEISFNLSQVLGL